MWFTPGDRVMFAPGHPHKTGWRGTVTEGARPRPVSSSPVAVAVRWDNGDTENVPPARLILLHSAQPI
jgi:hypothetical protein